MADIFISYKRNERARVKRIAELLREKKFSLWFDANLEVGKGEGFDAEIEREVTSAACVIVCWTPMALRSIYVKAEAKKGLDRDVLVPVFLQPCTLPVPFNAIDTADLSAWSGESENPNWKRVLVLVESKVEEAKRDAAARMAQSAAAYERIIDNQIFPGTLALLSRRIAALHELDAANYQTDVEALLSWLHSIAEKEAKYVEGGYGLANRQSGGSAWRYWDSGDAAGRSSQIARMRALLDKIQDVWRQLLCPNRTGQLSPNIQEVFSKSQSFLDLPAP